jgi:hypothetical protein
MTDIKDYLSSEDKTFEEGIALLKAHLQNTHLLHKLTVRKDQQGLEIELQKVLIHAEGFASLVVEIKTSKPTTKKEAPAKTEEETQAEIDDLAQKLNDLYVQRCQLSNQLADIPEGSELEEKVKEVLAKKEEYRQLFIKKQALENGTAEMEETDAEKKHTPKELPSVAILKLKAELQPLREKASKLKDKIAKSPSHPKLKEWETELAQVEASKEQLEQKKKLLESDNE